MLTALMDDTGDRQAAGSADSRTADPRRVVLFLNPTTHPLPVRICRNEVAPQSGQQTGDHARVYAVLCNGTEPVAEARGTLPATGQSDRDIKNSVAAVEESLVEAIRPSEQ
jgi:hypothetical protein